MAAPATPEIATDVSFSNAETGRMPTPNKLNLITEHAIVQPGAIGNKPPTSGLAAGDYILVQKADGKLYKCPASGVGSGASQGPQGDPGPAGCDWSSQELPVPLDRPARFPARLGFQLTPWSPRHHSRSRPITVPLSFR